MLSVEILPTTAQMYNNLHFNKLATGESLKVITNDVIQTP